MEQHTRQRTWQRWRSNAKASAAPSLRDRDCRRIQNRVLLGRRISAKYLRSEHCRRDELTRLDGQGRRSVATGWVHGKTHCGIDGGACAPLFLLKKITIYIIKLPCLAGPGRLLGWRGRVKLPCVAWWDGPGLVGSRSARIRGCRCPGLIRIVQRTRVSDRTLAPGSLGGACHCLMRWNIDDAAVCCGIHP